LVTVAVQYGLEMTKVKRTDQNKNRNSHFLRVLFKKWIKVVHNRESMSVCSYILQVVTL